MSKAKAKLPKRRIRVTLDDALFVSSERVYIDLFTPHGDLLLEISAQELGGLIGEVANSVAVNPLAAKRKLRLVS